MAENNPHIPTLYEWAGGSDAFERLVKKFYKLTLQDDLLKAFLKRCQTVFFLILNCGPPCGKINLKNEPTRHYNLR